METKIQMPITQFNQAVIIVDKDKLQEYDLKTLLDKMFTNILGSNVYLKKETKNRLTLLISGHHKKETEQTIKSLS